MAPRVATSDLASGPEPSSPSRSVFEANALQHRRYARDGVIRPRGQQGKLAVARILRRADRRRLDPDRALGVERPRQRRARSAGGTSLMSTRIVPGRSACTRPTEPSTASRRYSSEVSADQHQIAHLREIERGARRRAAASGEMRLEHAAIEVGRRCCRCRCSSSRRVSAAPIASSPTIPTEKSTIPTTPCRNTQGRTCTAAAHFRLFAFRVCPQRFQTQPARARLPKTDRHTEVPGRTMLRLR